MAYSNVSFLVMSRLLKAENRRNQIIADACRDLNEKIDESAPVCDSQTVVKSEYFRIGDQDNKWQPDKWELALDNIREMRKSQDAPVDTMGCNSCADENAPAEVKRYQILVSLMLSSQTKDEVTFAAMERLRKHGLTIDNILQTDVEDLGQIIIPVGFWKTKAKHIKKTTEILKTEHDGDIPDSIESLLKLPGVGPKMAHLCMTTAWDKITGIGVDTHVHRISNRLKWVKSPTSSPEKTRIQLESWLPRNLWGEVNHLLVGFGQQVCRPVSPKCDTCLNSSFCPSKELF